MHSCQLSSYSLSDFVKGLFLYSNPRYTNTLGKSGRVAERETGDGRKTRARREPLIIARPVIFFGVWTRFRDHTSLSGGHRAPGTVIIRSPALYPDVRRASFKMPS